MPDRESTGGPVACEPPFIKELRKIGIEVEEVTYGATERDARSGVWTRAANVLRTARLLRRRLRTERFDLVHLNTSFDTKALARDALTVFMIGRRPSKLFLKFHGSDARLLTTKNPLLRMFGKYLLARLDGAGLLSSEEKENFVRAGLPERKIFVVKNAVSKPPVQPEASFRAKLGIAENVPILLFIARFIPAKGLLDVIRACRILRERKVDFVLFCVGDGPARPAAEAEVVQSGLQEQVRLTGFIPEEQAAEFYANATMLLFPTYHYEGFPMVIFNAVAAGTALITTRIRAAADYLREPDNCLWVEPQNPSMLADRIMQLWSNRELREAISRNNRTLAQQFTPQAITREYLEAYEKVIGDE